VIWEWNHHVHKTVVKYNRAAQFGIQNHCSLIPNHLFHTLKVHAKHIYSRQKISLINCFNGGGCSEASRNPLVSSSSWYKTLTIIRVILVKQCKPGQALQIRTYMYALKKAIFKSLCIYSPFTEVILSIQRIDQEYNYISSCSAQTQSQSDLVMEAASWQLLVKICTQAHGKIIQRGDL
jgi:hypothetical protein